MRGFGFVTSLEERGDLTGHSPCSVDSLRFLPFTPDLFMFAVVVGLDFRGEFGVPDAGFFAAVVRSHLVDESDVPFKALRFAPTSASLGVADVPVAGLTFAVVRIFSGRNAVVPGATSRLESG